MSAAAHRELIRSTHSRKSCPLYLSASAHVFLDCKVELPCARCFARYSKPSLAATACNVRAREMIRSVNAIMVPNIQKKGVEKERRGIDTDRQSSEGRGKRRDRMKVNDCPRTFISQKALALRAARPAPARGYIRTGFAHHPNQNSGASVQRKEAQGSWLPPMQGPNKDQ